MEDRTCEIEGCDAKHYARGWCKMHYSRWSKHRSTEFRAKPRGRRPTRLCSVEGCGKKHLSLGFCCMHYKRVKLYGRLERLTPATYAELIWKRIERQPDGCWRWVGQVGAHGYGAFRTASFSTSAHRAVYELIVGPIPPGLQLDHLCRNTLCVNPSHLEPVTPKENIARGLRGRLKTECAHGHPWVEENLYVKSSGARGCKLCRDANNEARRAAALARYEPVGTSTVS